MTDLITVTIAVPSALIADARQLARCIGYSADDENTFREPSYQDSGGNLYAVASGPVKPAFIQDAVSALIEPEWGADLVAANRAQATLNVTDARYIDGVEPGEIPSAIPDYITAVIGIAGTDAIRDMGLFPVPVDI